MIEALIALTILAIALAGLALLVSSTISTNGEARRFSAANALAQAQIDTLASLHFQTSRGSDSLDETGGKTGAAFYTRSWTAAPGPVSQSKILTVTVSWTDKVGAHQVVLQSLLSL